MNKEKHIKVCLATVEWFKSGMYSALVKKNNVQKLHWSECTNTYLHEQINSKLAKLYENVYGDEFDKPTEQLLRERIRLATDIGNFAMMIADKADRKLEN